MLKYLLMVTLFNVKIISGEEKDDDAFVNSLPEEQKVEFLKKLETRIQKEVREMKTTNANETSIDSIEKHLENQGKLVKEIVRKEIDSLKRRMNQPNQQNSEGYIDLTLRSEGNKTIDKLENISKKMQNTNESTHVAQIPVAVNYDANSNKGKRDVSNQSIDISDAVKLANDTSKTDEDTNASAKVNASIARRSGNVITFDDIKTENEVSETTEAEVTKSIVTTSNVAVNTDRQTVQQQVTVKTEMTTQASLVESTIDNVASNDTNNKENTTTQGNVTDNTAAIDITTMSYASTSQKHISTVNNENKNNSEGVYVTTNPIATEHNVTIKTGFNSNEINNTRVTKKIDSTLHDTIAHTVTSSKTHNILNNDSAHVTTTPFTTHYTTLETISNALSNTMMDSTESKDGIKTIVLDSITTPLTIKRKTPNTIPAMKTNNYNTTTTLGTTLQRDDVHYTKEPEPPNDSRPTDNENQPLLVPVHNYNPENAYFNTFNNQGPNGNDKQIIIQNTSNIRIHKEIENRSNNNPNSIFLSESKTDLRIEDIKEHKTAKTSNTKIEINTDDIMSSGEIRTMFNSKTKSYRESRANIPDDKPLKHSLNKIREILFRHNITFDDMKDDRRDPDVISKKLEVGFGFPQKDRVETNPTQFNTFGTLLKNLIDHADDSRYMAAKPETDEASDSDTDVYYNVINSLKKHNMKLQNRDLHQTIKTLENVNRIKKKQLRIMAPLKNEKKEAIDKNKTRFQIKYRDDRKPNHDTLEQDISVIDFRDILLKDKNKNRNGKRKQKLMIGDKYLRLHANLLKDMVEQNDMGLQNYDWLTTTVNIQAAIAKLQDIIKKEKHDQVVNRLDHRLLKLVSNLYKTAMESVKEREVLDPPARRHYYPRLKSKKGKIGIHFGNRARYLDMDDFSRSLDCLKNCLNDFHTAIKEISLITTYRKQQWFRNIKQLYLDSGNEKEYLELLLHLVTARLFKLLEDSGTTIFAEDGDVLKKNAAALDRIGVEFVMMIRICNGLAGLND